MNGRMACYADVSLGIWVIILVYKVGKLVGGILFAPGGETMALT